MNKQTTRSNRSVLLRFIKATFMAGFLAALVLLFGLQSSHAGSATWLATPVSGDWNTAANWTAGGPPNGAADTATFAFSNITGVSVSANTMVDGILFNVGASALTITVGPTSFPKLTVSGVGITNNSGITQNFVTAVDGTGLSGGIRFKNSATAGNLTVFTNQGCTVATGANPSFVYFYDTSSAGNASFSNNGGTVNGAYGGFTNFTGTSTADNGIFSNNGGAVNGAIGGYTNFLASSTAGNGTLTNNGGVGGGAGGTTYFSDDSTGGTARVEVFANGNLDISFHNAPGVTVGSIAGNGTVFLGANKLTVGANNLTTAFSGVIQDGGIASGTGGSLTKTGKGKLTLSGANTYTGGTTVSKGTLLVTNRTGSTTGTGLVGVNAGTLGGTGKISGAVTIGTATSAAILAPGSGTRPAKLTLSKTLTFNARANYKVDLNSTLVTADQVTAKGVTINSGATVTIGDLGTGTLTGGTVFTVVNNIAATPIAGTFSNLADGSTLIVGSNTYKTNYEGGTGNDLTLAVQ